MSTKPRRSRGEGMIRRRGNSFQAILYAGVDPVTGRQLYLRGSAPTEAGAKKILRGFQAQVAEQRHAKTRASLRTTIESWLETHELEETTRATYVGHATKHIYPVIGDEPIGAVTAHLLERFYAALRRCSDRCDGRPFVEHRVDGPHECREVRHKRPPGRPPAAGYPPHDCAEKGCTVVECPQHVCRPLAAATVRKIHFIIRGVMTAAMRWGWITANSAEIARVPRSPAPDPDPPTSAEAAALVAAAWEEGPDWGTLVWLVMVTGLRRAELLALRWSDIDLDGGTLYVRRNHVRVTGKSVEKDTKTHRARRLAVDETTVEILREHLLRYEQRCRELGVEPRQASYLFSYAPTNDRACDPSGVSHRYGRMWVRLGIDSHLHALRHYSATELLGAGVDLRTVAGRLALSRRPGRVAGGAEYLCHSILPSPNQVGPDNFDIPGPVNAVIANLASSESDPCVVEVVSTNDRSDSRAR